MKFHIKINPKLVGERDIQNVWGKETDPRMEEVLLCHLLRSFPLAEQSCGSLLLRNMQIGIFYNNTTQQTRKLMWEWMTYRKSTQRTMAKDSDRPEYGQYLWWGVWEDWKSFLPNYLSQVLHGSTACRVHQQLTHFICLQNLDVFWVNS